MENEIVYHIDMSVGNKGIYERIKNVWGKYIAYHIYNVPHTDYVELYENLAEQLGTIRLCPSVNSADSKLAKSTDIKVNPNLYHFYTSNVRQPLHTDYAYYEESESPDWLMLYAMDVAEFGGKTHILSNKTLVSILEKYNPDLLEAIQTDVVWKYLGKDGEKIHTRSIYDGTFMNWNYFQIKEELNTPEVMKFRQDFFDFLEKFMVAGDIYDFSKSWSVGDCVIFNDKLCLHARNAFLGNSRWLKDHALYNKNYST